MDPIVIWECVIFLIIIIILLYVHVLIVEESTHTIVYRFGKQIDVIKTPGLHIRRGFFLNFKDVRVQKKSIDLKNIKLLSKNGISVEVSGAVVYEIKDVVLACVKLENYLDFIINASHSILTKTVSNMNIRDIYKNNENQDNIDTIDKNQVKMFQLLADECKKVGIEIHSFQINEFYYDTTTLNQNNRLLLNAVSNQPMISGLNLNTNK